MQTHWFGFSFTVGAVDQGLHFAIQTLHFNTASSSYSQTDSFEERYGRKYLNIEGKRLDELWCLSHMDGYS